MSNEKNTFADNSRVEHTIFLMEKLSFSLNLFSGDFYGQSFIKTVRGPLEMISVRGIETELHSVNLKQRIDIDKNSGQIA